MLENMISQIFNAGAVQFEDYLLANKKEIPVYIKVSSVMTLLEFYEKLQKLFPLEKNAATRIEKLITIIRSSW